MPQRRAVTLRVSKMRISSGGPSSAHFDMRIRPEICCEMSTTHALEYQWGLNVGDRYLILDVVGRWICYPDSVRFHRTLGTFRQRSRIWYTNMDNRQEMRSLFIHDILTDIVLDRLTSLSCFCTLIPSSEKTVLAPSPAKAL